MIVRTRLAIAMIRLYRSSVMMAVMCSSLISLTGLSPMAGKMWLFSAPRNPETDLLTRSADLNFIHSSAT
ncbi:hypothetical protein D3C78_1766580 [compost metagenome]